MYKYKGDTKCLKEWAEKLGINYSTLWTRIMRKGWSFLRAIKEPVHIEMRRAKEFKSVLD